MTYDPLILKFLKLLGEDEDRQLEILATTTFENLYDVGQIQGRLHGIKIARAALDAASKELEE